MRLGNVPSRGPIFRKTENGRREIKCIRNVDRRAPQMRSVLKIHHAGWKLRLQVVITLSRKMGHKFPQSGRGKKRSGHGDKKRKF